MIATVRYTELNPVTAGLCEAPDRWRWSSVHAHLEGRDDILVTAGPGGQSATIVFSILCNG